MKKFNLIWGIILLNVLCYFIPEDIAQNFVINTSEREFSNMFIQFFTYMFIHHDIFHLLNNMLFLFLMGETMLLYIEKYIIVWFYIQIGIISGILFYILYLELGIDTKLMGASAGLYGFLGYLTYLAPDKKVYIFKKYFIKLIVFSTILMSISLYHITQNYNFGGNISHLIGFSIGVFLSIITTYIYNYKD